MKLSNTNEKGFEKLVFQKKLIYPIMLVLLSTLAFAQTGMMHYSGERAGINLMAFVYFAVIAFIFSVIFWLTHNWLVKKR